MGCFYYVPASCMMRNIILGQRYGENLKKSLKDIEFPDNRFFLFLLLRMCGYFALDVDEIGLAVGIIF